MWNASLETDTNCLELSTGRHLVYFLAGHEFMAAQRVCICEVGVDLPTHCLKSVDDHCMVPRAERCLDGTLKQLDGGIVLFLQTGDDQAHSGRLHCDLWWWSRACGFA